MERLGKFPAARTADAAPTARGESFADAAQRRTGMSREELRIEIRRIRFHRNSLATATAILFAACTGLAFWALQLQTTGQVANARQQEEIRSLSGQLAAATSDLDVARREVDALVSERIPGLIAFRVEEPLAVDTPYVREFSFKPTNSFGSVHEAKLVMENNSGTLINPSLDVVLFDEVGVEISRAEIVNGDRDALRADEIRTFFASLEIPEGRTPRYFRLTSD
jgi:hypothetical protein